MSGGLGATTTVCGQPPSYTYVCWGRRVTESLRQMCGAVFSGHRRTGGRTVPHDEGFLRAILEDPDDDALRLVYADWLEEHDQPQRAEFVRLSCELTPLGFDDPRRQPLERRAARLLKAHRREWLGPLIDQQPEPSFEGGLPVCQIG